jgi:hypothetical protein
MTPPHRSTDHEGSSPPPSADAALPSRDARTSLASPLSLEQLHPRLDALLLRVQAAEREARGVHRRPTFRLMRELLGACVRLGVPLELLAECLGSSRESVRNRATALDGTVSAELVLQLTGLTVVQLDLLSGGELTRHTDQADQLTFRSIDMVRALLKTPTERGRPGRG